MKKQTDKAATPHLAIDTNTLSKDRNSRDVEVWEHMQRGLIYPAANAIFLSIWLDDKGLSRKELSNLKREIRTHIHTTKSLKDCSTTAILGVGVAYWKGICADENLSIPKGMTFKFPTKDGNSSTVIERSSKSFKGNRADLWFHIKSDKMEACQAVEKYIVEALGARVEKKKSQEAASKSLNPSGKGGKVLGSRFSENLNNPTDPVSIAKHCLIGSEDIEHFGGSYVLAQRFNINWGQIHSMSEDQIEDIIGRKTNDTIIPDRDTRTHIKSARKQDEAGNTTPIMRLGLPFGTSVFAGCPHMAATGSNIGDEAGIYFAGYTKNFQILETIMDSQIGNSKGFMNDRLFDNVKSDLGGFYYIPSIKDLQLHTGEYLESKWEGKKDLNWKRFPGMNWGRLDRHFDTKSENEIMHYNHKEYLFNQTTLSNEERKERNAPSFRILSLLENSFSRWQDNWYIDRKQQELGHITSYVDKFKKEYPKETIPNDIMEASIMIRKGWATRLTLHELASDEYGFRGQRFLTLDGKQLPVDSSNDHTKGRVINGADSFRIQPEEILVGAMPNLSLGEGRYVMLYLSEKERMDGFLADLSEASGVGHNIPAYDQLVELGLDGLVQKVETHRKKLQANKKEYFKSVRDEAKEKSYTDKMEFYESCLLTLKGVSEYALRYAALAFDMSKNMSKGQQWEVNNLKEIGQRMTNIAHSKPATFTEAIQLIFTYHSCLHLNGEPTALGRLDQVLFPFYKADIASGVLTKEGAQEVLDAFCIKLDEKVQSNRIFVEDHQPFGNLAMGGSSGPYPQGASINQWVQQLTVGGCDPKTGKSSYNDLSTMFIRCSSRLPLNTPCLSLRMRKDVPEEVLEEAARAVLSGGAHPIFLNDELFIDGLKQSGDNVGGEDLSKNPKWSSKVTIESARNYACDGCYEPQFPGENWFSLGGFSTLEPLECALNRGKTYSSAGSTYFRGKVVSFTSEHASEIHTYEDLQKLYFKHFEWLNRKRINGQLMGYGANTKFCPTPLLSILIDDCIAKGQDMYSGGAKYNIYGPCYIALSSTINSLYAIRYMVYDKKTAVTSLPELLDCLSCDWGYSMDEPFVSSLSGEVRIKAVEDRYKRLREVALSLPRYGRGNADIDSFGDKIIEGIADISVQTFTEPLSQTVKRFNDLADSFGSEEYPFGIQIQPGVGTFENHVEMGSWNGASADGRRKGTTIASDLSSMPSPSDLPVDHQEAKFVDALAGFAGNGTKKLTDGGPTDFNIREDFPQKDLVKVLKQFAEGNSSNILTITVANPETMEDAMSNPETYDLLRVRTGGWTGYFTAMFPVIQEQHKRRPISIPD
ncbi:MAG: Dyp-type peroxidase [Fluviicola sp.]|nr:Dyp-type peroxidase [Fluviicola sp.]